MYPDMTKNLEKFKEVDGKWPLFLKKKKKKKTKRNISYVHPMKRVDEVGQKRTRNNYRVVGSWGGGAR